MKSRNLRHFRAFLAVSDSASLTVAAERCLVSQPAISLALSKLERDAGGALFHRTRRGVYATPRGEVLDTRLRRAIRRLDVTLAAVSPGMKTSATTAQLSGLVAVVEAQNVTLAARALGLAQPTVHRAIAQLEQAAGKPLFERTASGMAPTRACRDMALAARLAFTEFDQAEADLAEFDGRDAGRIVVGSLPLSRSVVLPEALARFHAARPGQSVTILDGPYDEMLRGLRRGEIDFMIGALRDPQPIADIMQEALFDDHLLIVARPGHPLASEREVAPELLARQSWAVPRLGTPARDQFERLFREKGLRVPGAIIECGSILLLRELLIRSDILGCISGQQATAEIRNGLLVPLRTPIVWEGRRIGLTMRQGWLPTMAQKLLLDMVREAARALAA